MSLQPFHFSLLLVRVSFDLCFSISSVSSVPRHCIHLHEYQYLSIANFSSIIREYNTLHNTIICVSSSQGFISYSRVQVIIRTYDLRQCLAVCLLSLSFAADCWKPSLHFNSHLRLQSAELPLIQLSSFNCWQSRLLQQLSFLQEITSVLYCTYIIVLCIVLRVHFSFCNTLRSCSISVNKFLILDSIKNFLDYRNSFIFHHSIWFYV